MKEPMLSLNKETGRYEGIVVHHVQVEAEIFERMIERALKEEHGVSDFTQVETYARIVEQTSKVSTWLNHPAASINTHPMIAAPAPAVPEVQQESTPEPSKQKRLPPGTRIEQMREKCRNVAPHLWLEQCRTPMADWYADDRIEYHRIAGLRSDEKKILKRLREEWLDGKFILSADAQLEEEIYQEEQQATVAEKVEVVAEAVNGSRFN